MEMGIKTLDFRTEIKASEDDGIRSFEAYGSTFGNIDSYKDIVMKGAFTNSLQKRMPKLAYQHDYTKLVGVIKNAEEDEIGLRVKGEFIDTPLGNQVYQEVKSGAINEMSIGYATKQSDYDEDGVRRITELDLYEVSFVTFPANDKAIITSVKSDIKTIKDFEHFLRDAGYSRKDAKRLALYGFKTSEEIQRDADSSELKSLLNNLQNQIKGN